MERFKIEFLNPAWCELNAISNYYLNVSGVKSAKRVTDMILNSISRLEIMPFSCPYVIDDFLKAEGYRVLICNDYLCFYRVIGNIIFIYHIVNGKRDYKKLFN